MNRESLSVITFLKSIDADGKKHYEHRIFDHDTESYLCYGLPGEGTGRGKLFDFSPIGFRNREKAEEFIEKNYIADIQQELMNLSVGFVNKQVAFSGYGFDADRIKQDKINSMWEEAKGILDNNPQEEAISLLKKKFELLKR